MVTLFNDMTFELGYNDTISSLKMSIGDITASLKLDASQDSISLPEIDKENYQSLNTLLDAISATKQYIENEKFYLSFNLNYDKYIVNGSLNYDENEISAYAQAIIDNTLITIRFLNNTIYLEINGLKVSFALDDIDRVSAFI